MVTIRELVEAGYTIQPRVENVTMYYEICNPEELTMRDIIDGEYDCVDEYGEFDDAETTIYIENDKYGEVFYMEELEEMLEKAKNLEDFESMVKALNN